MKKTIIAALASSVIATPALAQQVANPSDSIAISLAGDVVEVCELEIRNSNPLDLTSGVLDAQFTQADEDTGSVSFDFEIQNTDTIQGGTPPIGQISAGSMRVVALGYCNDQFDIAVDKANASGDLETTTSLAGSNGGFGNTIDYTATLFWNGTTVAAGPNVQSATGSKGPHRGDMHLIFSWPAQDYRVAGTYVDTVTYTLTAD